MENKNSLYMITPMDTIQYKMLYEMFESIYKDDTSFNDISKIIICSIHSAYAVKYEDFITNLSKYSDECFELYNNINTVNFLFFNDTLNMYKLQEQPFKYDIDFKPDCITLEQYKAHEYHSFINGILSNLFNRESQEAYLHNLRTIMNFIFKHRTISVKVYIKLVIALYNQRKIRNNLKNKKK